MKKVKNWTVEKKDAIEKILIDMWATLGMDIPNNYEDIVQYCYEDVCETADPVEWHSGDVAIAFRRWIENQATQPDENVQPKESVIIYGDRIDTVGQLRHIMKDLDDHDQLCIETINDNGDTEDLYPMYVDVIDGIKLTDDTIVREVRFCQMPNSEPDTRDKQPLVDMVIESLKSDIADGDCTVLDELLMKLPWEILKGSLPEDQWERFNPNKSFEDAKRLAIAEAKRKIEQGKLFKSSDESKESEDFTNGDPETLYSLASLYAQFVEDDFNNACDALYDALLTEFPEYE